MMTWTMTIQNKNGDITKQHTGRIPKLLEYVIDKLFFKRGTK